MDIHEKYLEIIFMIVLEQNRWLLREIGFREKIPIRKLYKQFLSSRTEFKQFVQSLSSSEAS
jgi:hypothetical protein